MSFVCNTPKWKGSNQDTDTNGNPIQCVKFPYRMYEMEDIRAGFRDSLDPMIQAQMGLCGENLNIDSGSATTTAGKVYYAIQCLLDTVIDGTTTKDRGVAIGAPLDGQTLAAGTVIYGMFSEVNLTSGLVRLMESPFNV